MTTPTREQVIEWALLTDPEIFHPDIDLYEDDIDFLLAFSLLAMSAGREQGLREAKEKFAQMVAGEKFRDGNIDARRGPPGVGTWHESSPLGTVMRSLEQLIRSAEFNDAAIEQLRGK